MPHATFEIVSPGIVDRARASVSVKDASLAEGQQNPESKYGEFAATIDQIRREQDGPPLSDFLKELPENFEEADLLFCVERAVRAGSVEAIKHLLEMRPDLRPGAGPR